ncbi:orange carotenoid protein N-terminal domain-containing protein [Cronbergia sp. UHCC 0137]|uniref:orange carotenoid protein N-terminal domain-containing protein n=1 Tax=Cronbergia sp. UHCC 0137 TaxID=3110239 RepID=UPI002B1EF0A2|nr:orange carotenoid protein N-terminal domain-containing protein [Cronbergia sp. UHCC 0137]MEA5620598.1 orange carotenoid protein N-terminal domain-containing protein [Cronbergia sp. UHCC 0137]
MTATNVGSITQASRTFQQLNIDDKLAILGLIYKEKSDQIPANIIDLLPTDRSVDLVAQIQQLSPQEQLFALRDLLPATRHDQDEIMLDPHPSKAMVELSHGGTTIPTGAYGEMNTEGKLAFWYLLAERLGSTIIGIPDDYHPSEPATTLLNSLKALHTNDLLAFLKQIL